MQANAHVVLFVFKAITLFYQKVVGRFFLAVIVT
jgi:hypothetical protein